MCYRVLERYAVCRCLYHKHVINPCPHYGEWGHQVDEKTVLVGYACGVHADCAVDMLQEVNQTKTGENDRSDPQRDSTGLKEGQPVQEEDPQQVDTCSRASRVGLEPEWDQPPRPTPTFGANAELFRVPNTFDGALAASEKIADVDTMAERETKILRPENHCDKSLEQYYAKPEKKKTSEQHDMKGMERKEKLEKAEEEMEGPNRTEELLGDLLRNMANCLIFPGVLDEGAYLSVTKESLDLRLAVLEIWPSRIQENYSFDAKIRQALSHVGLCEVPLLPGRCRLRWRCRCGAEPFDDYMIPGISLETINEAPEKRKMAPQEETLRKEVMRDTVRQILDGFADMIGKSWIRGVSVVTRSSPQMRSSVGNVFKEICHEVWRMIQELGRDLHRWKTESELPSHRGPTVRTAPTQPPASSRNIPVHLLACLPEQRLGTILHQKHISNLEFDRDLFVLLKAIYEEHRGQLRSIFTMRKPTGIHFNEVFIATGILYLHLSILF